MNALDLMCPHTYNDPCTPEKWFEYMGNATSNRYVPFQINYVTKPMVGYIPFNKPTVPCNEAPNVSVI